jgi:protein TonB
LPVPVDPCPAAAARVRRRIDAEKRYPPLARRRGVVGSVDVAFETGLDGALRSATVRRSSGSALLDEAALDAVRRAAPFAAPGCAFTVPVNFVLTD